MTDKKSVPPIVKTGNKVDKGKGKMVVGDVPVSGPGDSIQVTQEDEDDEGDFEPSSEETQDDSESEEESEWESLEETQETPGSNSVDQEIADLLDEAQEFGDGGEMVLGLRSGRARARTENQKNRGDIGQGSSSSGLDKKRSLENEDDFEKRKKL